MVLLGASLVVVGIASIAILVVDSGNGPTDDGEIDDARGLEEWERRTVIVAVGLMSAGFVMVGAGLMLKPASGEGLDSFYVKERQAFDVEASANERGLREDAPYWRQHVKVGTVVVFCETCGHANLPEDERCSQCGRRIMEEPVY